MVKTMESLNGGQAMSGFEMPYDDPDGLESDFSVISHPTTNEHPLNVNFEHLQHLNFTGSTIEQSTSNEVEPASTPSIQNSIIQQHLEQILKENMELKEALQQNNTTLRQHFQTLITWQEQQTKARIRHKQMVDDLQRASLSLQREKDSLVAKVLELESSLNDCTQESEKQVATLGEKEAKIAQLTLEAERREVMCLQLEQQLKEMEADCELMRKERTVEKENSKFEKVNSVMFVDEDFGYSVVHHSGLNRQNSKEEIERLEATVEALHEGKTLVMRLLSEKETELKEIKEKFEMSLLELEKLRLELEARTTSLECLPISVAGPPDQKWVLMETGIMNSTNDYEAAVNCLQKYGNRFESIDQQLGECQKRLLDSMRTENDATHIEQLRNEVESLRNLLRNEQESKETDRRNLEESQLKFDALHKEYKALMKQWHDYQSEMQTKSRQVEALSLIEKRKHQEELDELTAKSMMQEELIHDKDADLLQLKNRVDILMRESEQIPILRAQAELFQQKLKKKEEEGKKNESTIEAQKRDIQSLQAQVVQLMDEINHQNQSQVMQLSGQAAQIRKLHQEHRSGSSSAPHSRRHSAERYVQPLNEQPEESKEELMECPRCRAKFRTLQSVENHVEECCFGPNSAGNPFL